MRDEYSKEDYKTLKEIAKENNIRFFAVDESDSDYYSDYNGYSVAYRPSIDSLDCVMLEVSVSYCAKADVFKNKRGKFHAINKLVHGEFVKLPLAGFMRDNGSNEVEDALAFIFRV